MVQKLLHMPVVLGIQDRPELAVGHGQQDSLGRGLPHGRPAFEPGIPQPDQYIRYLVLFEGQIQLVDSVDGLASLFAPIDSAEEALSYAVATSGLSALYDINETPDLKLYTTPVEETFVKETGDGYLVHLFHTYLCGCGPHIVRSMDVTVSKDGTITISEPVEAFSDPQYDGLCVD